MICFLNCYVLHDFNLPGYDLHNEQNMTCMIYLQKNVTGMICGLADGYLLDLFVNMTTCMV